MLFVKHVLYQQEMLLTYPSLYVSCSFKFLKMSIKLVRNNIARNDEMKHEEENIIKQFRKTIASTVHQYHKSLPSKMFNMKDEA